MARRKFSSKFKTRLVIEALSGRYTIQELARKHEVHASQISQWKAHFLENADGIFDQGKDKSEEDHQAEKAKLYKVIGQQKVEIDFLKDASSKLGL